MKPISIIIITYNRPADTLELLDNIAQLDKANELLQDVVVVNNASQDDYSAVKSYVANSTLPFVYKDAPANLGVTKGRNYALQFAQGNIIIFLDDDAVLQLPTSLQCTMAAFSQPGIDQRPIGIVSFKVLYYDTLQLQKNALPHKNYEAYKNMSSFFTYFFAGGAHAIKREVLSATGNLPEEFFYGMEEYDLSYRVIDKGYCIKYDNSIIMLHKESPLGRAPKADKLRMMWVNKSKVAYRYLPLRYYYSTAFMWSLQYLKITGFDFAGWLKGWKLILDIPSSEQRRPIGKAALHYLHQVKARLSY